MRCKNLYRGAFNYRQSAVILYAYALTEKQAWLVMCRRLAKRHGVNLKTVMGLFDGSKQNYEINCEMEMNETEENYGFN